MTPLVLCEGLKTREQFEVGVLVFQELLKFSAKCQRDGKGWDMEMGQRFRSGLRTLIMRS